MEIPERKCPEATKSPGSSRPTWGMRSRVRGRIPDQVRPARERSKPGKSTRILSWSEDRPLAVTDSSKVPCSMVAPTTVQPAACNRSAVRLTPLGVSAFVKRATEIVASGRPPCPFCGQPLNPEGHICARRNGFMH